MLIIIDDASSDSLSDHKTITVKNILIKATDHTNITKEL